MHLVVINCSPRVLSKSNTNIILKTFLEAYTKEGNTVERYNLSQRDTWPEIRRAFTENTNILMALPLFVECIPGLMLAFLEGLSPKQADQEGKLQRTQLSFLLQGGFSEASQFRCAEQYLQQLPAYLGCDYGGTLIKGEMFIVHMMPTEAHTKMVAPFAKMAEAFAADGVFTKEKADAFAGPEYFTKGYIVVSNFLLAPVKKLLFELFFQRNGCTTKLTAKPYAAYVQKKQRKCTHEA